MNLSGLLQSVAAANVAALAPSAEPERPAVVMPRIIADAPCEDDLANVIVVCGRTDRDDDYRIPEAVREEPVFRQRDTSWAIRTRSEDSLQRYSDQTVGPSGFLQHSRQIDCEWRMARQEIEGKPLDCTAKGITFGK